MADQTKQPPLNSVGAADLPAYPVDAAAAREWTSREVDGGPRDKKAQQHRRRAAGRLAIGSRVLRSPIESAGMRVGR